MSATTAATRFRKAPRFVALGLGGLVLLVVVVFVNFNWWRHPKRGPGVFKVSDIPKDHALTGNGSRRSPRGSAAAIGGASLSTSASSS